MLKRFRVESLQNSISCDIDFQNDLNVLTGRNGSGKTTILKLIWYLISANIERIPREMIFERVELETENISIRLTAEQRSEGNPTHYRINYTVAGSSQQSFVASIEEIASESPKVRRANRVISAAEPATTFFPTFRRMEGGFSIGPALLAQQAKVSQAYRIYDSPEPGERIQLALQQLSTRLSVGGHRFVTSVSTEDIVALLTERWADASAQTNKLQFESNRAIFGAIHKYRERYKESDAIELRAAESTLSEIDQSVQFVQDQTEQVFRPIQRFTELISRVFRRHGIKITDNIVLGSGQKIVSSASLSAGEKQMLSFLSYNAFLSGRTIFIDEPELSLHADWQRSLFPTLLSQESSNQFIVATHSPFIYSNYPDKEFIVADKED